MNDRQTDFELLPDYRHGDQSTFTALMRRHLDLVYATAARKAGDMAAQEVAQNVFSALARKSWMFSPDDSLPAWLYRATILEASHWLRDEMRRKAPEQTAIAEGLTMNAPEESAGPNPNGIEPQSPGLIVSKAEAKRRRETSYPGTKPDEFTTLKRVVPQLIQDLTDTGDSEGTTRVGVVWEINAKRTPFWPHGHR